MSESGTLSPGGLLGQRRELGCLLGTWLLSVVTQGYIIVPASVLPVISDSFGVSQATAVWIVSAAPAAWALSNFAVGVGIDRVGDVTAISLAVVVFVLACLLGWLAAGRGQFWLLLVSRGLAGVTLGIIWTASANVVGQAFSDRTRGTALGLFTTSAPAGFALGQVVTPYVDRGFGWSVTFLLVAGGSLLAFALFRLSVLGIETERRQPSGSVRGNFSSVLGNRSVRYGCAMAFVAYSLYLFLNSWIPSYLSENFTMSLTLTGALVALFPAVGIVSRAGGGYVSDRFLGRRRLPVLKLSFVVALPAIAVIATTGSIAVIVAVLLLAGFVIQLTFGIVYSYVQEEVEPSIAGTALSVLGTIGISGAFSAPLVAGSLIDVTGTYGAAFAYAGILAVCGIALAWFAPEPN